MGNLCFLSFSLWLFLVGVYQFYQSFQTANVWFCQFSLLFSAFYVIVSVLIISFLLLNLGLGGFSLK